MRKGETEEQNDGEHFKKRMERKWSYSREEGWRQKRKEEDVDRRKRGGTNESWNEREDPAISSTNLLLYLESFSLLKWNHMNLFSRIMFWGYVTCYFWTLHKVLFVLSAFVKTALVNNSGWRRAETSSAELDLNLWSGKRQRGGPLMPSDSCNTQRP